MNKDEEGRKQTRVFRSSLGGRCRKDHCSRRVLGAILMKMRVKQAGSMPQPEKGAGRVSSVSSGQQGWHFRGQKRNLRPIKIEKIWRICCL